MKQFKHKTLLARASMMLLAMLCFLGGARAQETLTIYEDGTATSSNIPVYGYSGDTQGTTSEFVIPASELTAMNGKEITALKFYVSSAAGAAWTATFQVYLKEIEGTTLSATTGPGNCTVVYTGTLDATGTTMDVVFDEGYIYNGGNLLIGTYVQTAGNWKSATFYGVEATGAAYQSGGYNQNGAKNFIPKTTFTYETPSSCVRPENLTVNYTEGETTATVSWTSDAHNFNIDVNGTITAITSTTYTLNVEPATTYNIKVQADCGDEQSGWASTSFFSGCTGISVPYTYGFEDASAFDCWTVEYSDDSYAGITTNLPRTGDQCFWFYYTANPGQYLISPQLSGITNGLHVEFWYRGYDNGVETFQVGYSTTDNNLESFTWGDEITASKSYQRFSANYPAGTKYVAVKHLSDDQYYLFLDDFLFEESASVLEPTGLSISNTSTTGATLSWTAGGSETAWDIYVTDDETDVPGDTTTPTVSNTSENPYALTNITSCTTYYVYVRAIKGSDKSAWSTPAIFNTKCEPIALPYSYNFEDAHLPISWNTIIENTSYTGINIMTPSNSSTNRVLAFYMGTYENPALIAVLPEVDVTNYPLNGYQISFDACYANTSTSNMTAGKLAIGIMTDPTDASTFELVEEVDITDGYSTFGSHTVWFNTYTGNGRYIAIRDIYTQTGYVLVDNIEVTPLPSCLMPTDLAVSNISDTSVDLSWTANGEETAWTIYYKAEGEEEYTEVPDVKDNPYTLQGLVAGTNYQFYVVANCSETSASEPSEVFTFTTALCALEDQCEITYALTDSYGDGWNGNAINVVDASTEEVLATWTIDSGSTASGSLNVCNGREINFVFVTGSYPGETSYVVYDRNGDEIFSGSAGEGLVTNYTVDCTVPSCQKPIELTANADAHSAELSWTAQGEETAWTIYWKESGDEEYTKVSNVTAKPYTLDNLDPATAYEFYVVANCSDTDESDPSAVYEFTTPCDVITVAQGSAYTYDFEDETPLSCWTNVAGTNNRSSGSNHTDGGTYKLQFQGTTTGNIVAMPAFTPDINGLVLTFWTRPEGYSYSSCGTFSVGYMTDLDDASTFVAVDTYSYNDWTENEFVKKTAMFTNAPAGAYIAFRHNAGSQYYYWFVDDVEVSLVSLLPAFDLSDSENNDQTISDNVDVLANIKLANRTLFKDGTWNTFCVPFDVALANSPLAGAKVMELDVVGTYDGHQTGRDGETDNYYLFFKDASSIKAGKPYFVKWTTTGDDIVGPEFKGVTITTTTPTDIEATGITMKGNFSPVQVTANDMTTYFLMGDNKLYYTTVDRMLYNFRAYFKLDDASSAPNFTLGFDEGGTTRIFSIGKPQIEEGAWYDLNGRKYTEMPTAKGLYIHNGVKVIVK